jgi:hypothetical protein
VSVTNPPDSPALLERVNAHSRADLALSADDEWVDVLSDARRDHRAIKLVTGPLSDSIRGQLVNYRVM